MKTYSFESSYLESGDSSPHSRDIEFENPPPLEDSLNNYKVKFMCSYRGKIHPRTNGNELSYIGGETKILAVDRNIKFSFLLSKLIALCENENIAVKYQLPGEDLDALISVTNDDDLDHLMHEYDRLCKVSPNPARLRIFIFPSLNSSIDVKSEKERYVEVLNSGLVMAVTAPPPNNDVNFLYGLEKSQPIVGKVQESEVPTLVGSEDRPVGSDPIERDIQDLQRLRIEEQSGMYRRKNEDNLAAGFVESEYHKVPVTFPDGVGYWPENQIAGGMYPTSNINPEPPVYIIPAPASAYHAPIVTRTPVTGPPSQGYYAVQTNPSEVYREQQVYNLPPQEVPKIAGYYSGALGFVQPATGTLAYDNGVGRQVIYHTPGGIMAALPPAPPQHVQYEAMTATVTSDER
ncbi:Octicosapeptide/Phox/Bem1p family protein [Forsythia ovata]|uniref:Octicosapeptide/Phox/Bem1p family protein n=1 Tax=Forsythia ovata TaxID=205694 RepID=A0ABD1TM98_9LAMI